MSQAVRAMVYTMFAVTTLIVGYFIVSPVYYTMLDNLNTTVYDSSDSGSNAQDFADTAYGIFYYGLASLIVLGLLASIYWLYMFMRRRYYVSEVVVQ